MLEPDEFSGGKCISKVEPLSQLPLPKLLKDLKCPPVQPAGPPVFHTGDQKDRHLVFQIEGATEVMARIEYSGRKERGPGQRRNPAFSFAQEKKEHMTDRIIFQCASPK